MKKGEAEELLLEITDKLDFLIDECLEQPLGFRNRRNLAETIIDNRKQLGLYTLRDLGLDEDYLKDIIYCTTQHLELPDKDVAVLNRDFKRYTLGSKFNYGKAMKCEERLFEQEFGRLCPLWGMLYLKVPDFIHAKGNKIVAHKRFADGVLITVNGNYILEFKYKYGKLKSHQRKTAEQVNKINNSYYIVRKSVLKKGTIYTVENELGDFMFTTCKLEDLFEFFKQPTEQFSQQIMLNELIPSKKREN